MKRIVVLIVFLAILAGAGGFVWNWARPKDQVPIPPQSATPATVVKAYVAAVNARDFDTSNALLVTKRHLPVYNRFERTPTMKHLQVLSEVNVREGTDSYDKEAALAWKEATWVDVTFDYKGTDGSIKPGPVKWRYLVVRDRASDPWRIRDWGVLEES